MFSKLGFLFENINTLRWKVINTIKNGFKLAYYFSVCVLVVTIVLYLQCN